MYIHILFALRESRRGHWRLGGLEAGGSGLRYPGNPFQFQNDLSKFQNNLKCVFSVQK